jgi:hypothetical protein
MAADEAKHECHKKAVGIVDAYATIGRLHGELEFLKNERTIERQECTESKDRITESWKESCSK